jgi:murein DD-endopeptidase MepM/ murein hydrolase activator NlpD
MAVLVLVTSGVAAGLAVTLHDSGGGETVAALSPVLTPEGVSKPAAIVPSAEPGTARSTPAVVREVDELVSESSADEPVAAEQPSVEQPPSGQFEPVPSGDGVAGADEPADAVRVPVVRVAPGVARQGETTLVRLSDAKAASAVLTVAGFSVPMVRDDRDWVGYMPILPLSAVGLFAVVVDTFDGDGVYQTTFLSELEVVDASAEIEFITLDPGTAALLAPELVAIDIDVRFQQFASVTGPRQWVGPWQAPVTAENSGRFGVLRSYNDAPPSDWHHGHDFAALRGDPVSAAAAGDVVFAGELPVHGLGVIVDHGAGVFSGYWHMSTVAVVAGEQVAVGDVVGAVGETGLSAGPHLHWEVIVNGRDVDPIQWLEATLHE